MLTLESLTGNADSVHDLANIWPRLGPLYLLT
jgi:hypothetical protein